MEGLWCLWDHRCCYFYQTKDPRVVVELIVRGAGSLVVSTATNNRVFGDKKSVTLGVIEKHCTRTGFEGLKETVDACLAVPSDADKNTADI